MFFSGVSIVITMLIMIGVGVLLSRLGWFTPQVNDLLAKMVTHVALPSMTFSQLLTNYHRAELLASLPGLGMAMAAILLLYGLAWLLSRALRIPRGRRGVFRSTFTFGNTIFMGLPIAVALFGEQALPAALMFYLANTSLFWVVGVSDIQADSEAGRPGFSPAALKRLLTPPLITFVLCIVLILLEAPTAPPLMRAAGYIGNLVTPLAMLFIGGMLYNMLRQGLRWERGYGAFILARFVLSPGLILAVMFLFGGLHPLWRGAFLVQASMPCQSSCAIVAHSYRADSAYAAGGITITTLLSMLTIPLFAALTTVF
ncbi:MAG: AEC family transporter [Clostridia bacterium]|nr:AEC family transporter [Clostridia bacterium]